MNTKQILNLGLLIICVIAFFKSCNGCSSNSLSDGTYEYTDAIGKEYIIEIDDNGSAMLKMLSEPTSELEQYAYSRLRNGISGTWHKSMFLIGDGDTREYLDVQLSGAEYYICEDGYIYKDFYDMTSAKQSSGFEWSK